ncbi:MAG: CinA-like protein [Chlamydiae bacterium]|nr:CinA-like protein [Chlamydiota bacterium]
MSHEVSINQKMREKELTLATAESCTGGAIAARLTKVPDTSMYFLGSVVSYSNSMKEEVLHIPHTLIVKHGAVSPEIVRAMWEGILSLTGSDYAIAVTGIAGPTGGTPEKPVGTIWAAVGKRGEEPYIWNVKAEGDRETIIEATVDAVLNQLVEKLDI